MTRPCERYVLLGQSLFQPELVSIRNALGH